MDISDGSSIAFGWATLPQLRIPISATGGVLWTTASVLLLLLLALGARPGSFRSSFARDRATLRRRPQRAATLVTEAEPRQRNTSSSIPPRACFT